MSYIYIFIQVTDKTTELSNDVTDNKARLLINNNSKWKLIRWLRIGSDFRNDQVIELQGSAASADRYSLRFQWRLSYRTLLLYALMQGSATINHNSHFNLHWVA